jgi:hypothetical protein
MRFFNNIFSGKKGKEKAFKIIDAAVVGIDKLFFTQEEKAGVSKEIADGVQNFVKQSLDESTARSRTRRTLAIMIMSVYLGLILAASVVYIWSREYALFVFKVVGEITPFALMVAAFFFGAHILGRDLIKNKDSKK